MSETPLEIEEVAVLMVIDLQDLVSKRVHLAARDLATAEKCSAVARRHVISAIPLALKAVQSAFEILDLEERPHGRCKAA
jgi:hypothetical protein